jgi:hypothetical protein
VMPGDYNASPVRVAAIESAFAAEVSLGLGRIVALYHRSFASYNIH